MSTLRRTETGDYAMSLFSSPNSKVRQFFYNHEATRGVMMAARVPGVSTGEEVAEERVHFCFDQTRGGAFKIPEARYLVPAHVYDHTTHTYRPGYKEVPRDKVYGMSKDDESVKIEQAELGERGRLIPCSYDVR